MRPFHLLSILIITLVLHTTACQPGTATVETAVPTASSVESDPTLVITPTPFPQPSPTVIPTEPPPTATPPPIPTQTVTEQPVESNGSPLSIRPLPASETIQPRIFTQIGGEPHSIALQNEIAYVGFGPRLLAFDVSDPTSPQFLNSSGLLNGVVVDIATMDDIAYLATQQGGLATVQLDPTAPQLVTLSGGPGYAGAERVNSEKLFVHEDTLLLINRSDNGATQLLRFDLRQPDRPMLMETIQLPDNSQVDYANGVVAVGHKTAVDLLDADDPSRVLGSLPDNTDAAPHVALNNNQLVVLRGMPMQLWLLDISNPAEPKQIGSANVQSFFVNDLLFANGRLLISSTFGEFGYCGSQIEHVLISDDNQLVPHEMFSAENCIHDLALNQNTLFVTGLSGVGLFDLSDPTTPAKIGQFEHPDGVMAAETAVLQARYLYVQTRLGNAFELRTIDTAPPFAQTSALPHQDNPPLDLLLVNNQLIWLEWMRGAAILDLSNPAAPQTLSTPADMPGVMAQFMAQAVIDNTMYTLAQPDLANGQVGIVDLARPTEPQFITPFAEEFVQISSMAASDTHLYIVRIVDEAAVLAVFDIQDRLAPTLVTEIPLPYPVETATVANDLLLMGCRGGYACSVLLVADLTNPAAPAGLVAYQLPEAMQMITAVSDTQLVLTTITDTLLFLDVTDRENVQINGRFSLPGGPHRVSAQPDGLIVVAAQGGGVFLLTLP